jgi:hypothetical protein
LLLLSAGSALFALPSPRRHLIGLIKDKKTKTLICMLAALFSLPSVVSEGFLLELAESGMKNKQDKSERRGEWEMFLVQLRLD